MQPVPPLSAAATARALQGCALTHFAVESVVDAGPAGASFVCAVTDRYAGLPPSFRLLVRAAYSHGRTSTSPSVCVCKRYSARWFPWVLR